MKLKIDTKGPQQSRWYEYLVRFFFGGAVTALAGVVAKNYGPEIGGLFLAFPAIFPATATLIEKHDKQKKERAGKEGKQRARTAAGVDAAGAAMGSIGLIAFAVVIWLNLPRASTSTVLISATMAWLVTSVLIWTLRETIVRRARAWHRKANSIALHAGAHTRSSSNRRFDE